MADKTETFAPGAAQMDALARAALARIPEPFAAYLADVVLVIEEFADEETLREMGMEDPFELTGLYQGVSLTKQSVMESAREPDMVFLYRRAILDEWSENGEELGHLIGHVLVHEIGHHFGLSDEAMHAIEDAAG